jgi:hypothetical protein
MADEIIVLDEAVVTAKNEMRLPQAMLFAKRSLDVKIKGNDGEFSYKNHRVSLSIGQAGGEALGVMQAVIYGLKQDDLVKLTSVSVLGQENFGRSIEITARSKNADGQESTALAFVGVINTIYADFNQQPDVPLIIVANGAENAPFTIPDPTSINGQLPVENILQPLAEKAGFELVNSGVTGSLENSYYSGSALDQIRAICRAANINFSIEKGLLFIWPKNAYLNLPAIELSSQSGLVGYPSFSQFNLIVKSVFNPLYQMGRLINLETDITPLNGNWQITMMQHSLEAEMPNGQWFTDLFCIRATQ